MSCTLLTPPWSNLRDLIAKVKGEYKQAPGARQVCVHEVSRVARTVDTRNGKLSVDLVANVDGKDGFRVSIHQTPGISNE